MSEGPTKAQSDSALTLRDRIAKAIYLEANNWGVPDWETISPKIKPAYLAQADAVIAELGLRMEHTDSVPQPWRKATDVRWVTDWKADDE